MNRKNLTIILAVALIVSFFLPYIRTASGLDIVKAPFFAWEKYALLLIPVTGLLLLVGAGNNGNYPLGRGLLSSLPLLAVLFWIIGVPLIHGTPIGQLFKGVGRNFGAGFWISAATAIVLAFYNPRS